MYMLGNLTTNMKGKGTSQIAEIRSIVFANCPKLLFKLYSEIGHCKIFADPSGIRGLSFQVVHATPQYP